MAQPPIQAMLDRLAVDVGPSPDRTAELLVAIAHDRRDRSVWGGDRAITYWDRLPDRVRTACYAGPTVAHWWERMCRQLGCTQPSKQEDRMALAEALGCGRDAAVLEVIRANTEALCLRVRLSIQLMYEDRDTAEPSTATNAQEAML